MYYLTTKVPSKIKGSPMLDLRTTNYDLDSGFCKLDILCNPWRSENYRTYPEEVFAESSRALGLEAAEVVERSHPTEGLGPGADRDTVRDQVWQYHLSTAWLVSPAEGKHSKTHTQPFYYNIPPLNSKSVELNKIELKMFCRFWQECFKPLKKKVR